MNIFERVFGRTDQFLDVLVVENNGDSHIDCVMSEREYLKLSRDWENTRGLVHRIGRYKASINGKPTEITTQLYEISRIFADPIVQKTKEVKDE